MLCQKCDKAIIFFTGIPAEWKAGTGSKQSDMNMQDTELSLDISRKKSPTPSAGKTLRLVCWLVLAYFVTRHLVWVPWNTPASDFQIYIKNLQYALEGQSPFLEQEARTGYGGYSYPTFFLSILLPFSIWPPKLAQALWWLANLAILVAGACGATYWLRKTASANGLLKRLGILIPAGLLLSLAFLPSADNLRMGQNNLIVAGALALSIALAFRNQTALAGAAFALAILCKMQPIILLPAMIFLLGKRGLASTILCGLAYLLILWITGLWQWESYLLFEKIPAWQRVTTTPTLSFMRLMVTDYNMEADAALFRAGLLEKGVGLIYLAGLAWMIWKRVPARWHIAWAIPWSLLMSRFLEYHHLALLPVVYYLLAQKAEAEGRPALYIPLAASLLLANLTARFLDMGLQGGEYLVYGSCIFAAAGAMWAAWTEGGGKREITD